ncbi:MAG: hypothetical protein LBB98_13670 [Treponema sp.]|jgi:hypothetical protein|nr:hypothetical protein [Treponema sp.]
MQEIIIPELLAGFFITVSLIRPFFKRLRTLEGLVWLPVLALGIIIALFPAYGFRPECVPLLIYGFFCVLFDLSALVSLLNHSRDGDFLGQNPVPRAVMFALLVSVLGIALVFAPVMDSTLLEAGVTQVTLRDEERGEELFLRIYSGYDDREAENGAVRQDGSGPYGDARALKPFLILIPPVSGSVTVIDRVCGELRDAGFTVAAYSRRGFDSPAVGPEGKRYALSPIGWSRLFRAESRGRATVSANVIGRSLEEGRRQDIVFLLGLLRQSGPLSGSGMHEAALRAALAETDLSAVFLVGYDAGGAALLELSGPPDFAARYPAVKGIITVESSLFSVLTGEEAPTAPPPHDNWFIAVWSGICSRAAALRSRKLTGIGEVPRPGVPVCFILSDMVEEPRHRENWYAAILRVFRSTKVPAILVAAAGAGPLDYSDIPEKYPIYPFLRPGGKAPSSGGLTRGIHGPKETAALMTNFAATILEDTPVPNGTERTVLSRKPLSARNFHIEANAAWNSLKKGSIL